MGEPEKHDMNSYGSCNEHPTHGIIIIAIHWKSEETW